MCEAKIRGGFINNRLNAAAGEIFRVLQILSTLLHLALKPEETLYDSGL